MKQSNSNGFVTISKDMDYITYQKTLEGNITKKRYKLLDRWVRSQNKNYRCGHDWDCCGCLSSVRADLVIAKNKAEISVSYSYNY